MMNTAEINKLERRIEQIKKALCALGTIRPGSLSEQYNVCGNPTCRCKDPKHPKKHGPYYQLSYTFKGKSKSLFVKREEVETVREQLAQYKRFRELTQEWVETSIELLRLKRQAEGR